MSKILPRSAAKRPLARARRKSRLGAVSFTLLENGLDFLVSALEHAREAETSNDKRAFKYCILHLCAGVELILKERLRREHWSLLFEQTNAANLQSLRTGDFLSVSFATAVARLKGICRVSVSDQQKDALERLRRTRNKLEHFGLSDSPDALIGATARVASIVVDFIIAELRHKLKSKERTLLSELRSKSGEFGNLVRHRMQGLKPKLASAAATSFVVECPACSQNAYPPAESQGCLYCGHRERISSEAAREWIENVMGVSEYATVKDGGVFPLHTCPSCGEESLVDTGASSETSQHQGYLCFKCGTSYSGQDLHRCDTCNDLYEPGVNDMGMCDACANYLFDEDS